ncbi:Crp/Fnr family transcriptional regulator [Geitlerinema calcuttense]|uniref:Crp/Fnr family transcriptional regulator n=1 Tax=Geitlerinema calcuttense NRMC-F 0142 TaxID=2922238 RepID=A0ABT7M0F7_9CYAN|nr:Crp/Fnr family transcriptional regulator [Geitlerinema calcuttense]MCD8486931.1 Crp/Fnr family transcriptional regulator [Desertifilum sp.]MDI9636051.1 Crp/Fnr family transcriptional regulator [Geitlerinema splendidum]MDL5057539.1 Crp/Fnr family transcriptional regulator [Geitlerinema calcuttense NRMC-F 0142]
MKATLDQLASISIFTQLQPEQLTRLQPHSVVQTYQTGEIISHEGDRLSPRLYALIAGLLRVSKTASNGKETILRTLANGDIFAAPALFGNAIAPATVIAESEVQVLMVDRVALLAAIQENPEIALQMMAVFNQRLQQLHEMVHGLVSERAIVRLARLIQYAAGVPGMQVSQQGICLRQPLSYYEIARSIGITYEECVRLFKQLKPIVSYRRGGKITILDWEGLEAIARGSGN